MDALPYQLRAHFLQPYHREVTLANYIDQRALKHFGVIQNLKAGGDLQKFYSPIRFSLAIPTPSIRIEIMPLKSMGI